MAGSSRAVLFAAAVSVGGIAIACGLSATGVGSDADAGVVPDGASTSSSASSSGSTTGSSSSGSSSSSASSGGPVDAGSDAGACRRPGQALSYDEQVLADGPSTWLRFDEVAGSNAANAVATGPTATYSATGVTFGRPGAICSGSAVLLNGTSGRIRLSPTRSFPDGSEYTIEVWAKQVPDTEPNAKRRLFGFGQPSGTAGPKFFLQTVTDQNEILFERTGNGTYDAVQGQPVVSLTAWTHVVVTVGASITLYVDAVSRGAASVNAYGTVQTGSELVVGDLADPQFSYKWKGLADEFAIYDKILTPARIKAHYDAGK